MRGSKGERERERALIEVVIRRKVNIFMVKHVICNLLFNSYFAPKHFLLIPNNLYSQLHYPVSC
ncbi:hypothetical protein DVH24_038123 [Malus domestica]|uniref:Uncharacterized protein n=1 Tax=Malus domestica TaxID=3750 RepID=A0A498K6F9_MALDO|nr:hypothetical protein DVH24_038123 [Malus domestica]